MDARPKTRRLLRFALRGMLLLVLVIAISLGWMLRKVQRQGIAVASLKKSGWYLDNLDRDDEGGTLSDVRRLMDWPGEDRPMDLQTAAASEETTDADMVHVAELAQLKELILCGSQVTDAGLVQLGMLTQLKDLDLSATKVTDAGLVCIAGLTQLKRLNLDLTNVSDAGLVHLKSMARLERLSLQATQVTDDGVQELKATLPNCEIKR